MSKNKRLRYKRSTPIAWLVCASLAITLAIVASLQFTSQARAAEDDVEVKKVALTAFGASVQTVVLPNTATQFTAKNLKADAASIQTANQQATQMFDDIYAPSCSVCRTIVSRTYDSISAQANGKFRALGWGVKDVDWRQVLIDGQTASVTLAATLSSKVQYTDEFGKLFTANPTQGIVKIYALSKINNKWQITNIVEDAEAEQSLPVNKVQPHGPSGPPPTNQPTPTKGNGPQGTKPTLTPKDTPTSK